MDHRYKWKIAVHQKMMDSDTMVYLAFIRDLVTALPETLEKPCYGTPGFYVKTKLFARIKEDGETLVIQTQERGKWMEADPDTFFVTDHYLNYDYMLINLKRVATEHLETLLVKAWQNRAPAKLLKELGLV
jgi:hypothetical protein